MTINEKNSKRGRWWERGKEEEVREMVGEREGKREGRGREGDGGREGGKEGRKRKGGRWWERGKERGKEEEGREGVWGTISFSYSDLEVNQFIPDTDRFLQLKG